MVILQYSARNLQKTAYLARSGRKMVILQDLAEKSFSCNILANSFRRAVLLLALIHATHFILTRNLFKNQLLVFFKKNNQFE